ncbi:hypothetical protein [Bacillus pretiosus]|uniref:hypothetical protein n=1 Tax=Bacillus pretiosus TaxID=2983392 RepID=UPI003D65DBA8
MAKITDLGMAISDGMQRFGHRDKFIMINKGNEKRPKWFAVAKEERGNGGMYQYEERIRMRQEAQQAHRPSVLTEKI